MCFILARDLVKGSLRARKLDVCESYSVILRRLVGFTENIFDVRFPLNIILAPVKTHNVFPAI